MKKISNILPTKNPVVIHSNLLVLGKKMLLDKKRLKKTFLEKFNKGLFVPSFNINKKKIIRFDKNENTMRGLTNLLIKEKKFKRIINPVHSYIYANYSLNRSNYKRYSFGKNSIFDFFTQKNFTWINLGAENNAGYTIFHHAEELCKVKYRKYVSFKKSIMFKEKKISISYNYYSRKKKIIYDFDRPVRDMTKSRIIKINNQIISYGKCKEIVDFLCDRLIKDQKYLIK